MKLIHTQPARGTVAGHVLFLQLKEGAKAGCEGLRIDEEGATASWMLSSTTAFPLFSGLEAHQGKEEG